LLSGYISGSPLGWTASITACWKISAKAGNNRAAFARKTL
jgi:hypothetical protein